MLTEAQLTEFKGKVLTKMLRLAGDIAVKEAMGGCKDSICDYNYLSLMKDAIFMKDSGLTPEEIEIMVYRVTSRGKLDDVVSMGFFPSGEVLQGMSPGYDYLNSQLTIINNKVDTIYQSVQGMGDLGVDCGNARTIYAY